MTRRARAFAWRILMLACCVFALVTGLVLHSVLLIVWGGIALALNLVVLGADLFGGRSA